MESNSEAGLFHMPSLRTRSRLNPDVPEDVAVALLHLNDPNWDFDGSDTASFESAGFEMDEKFADTRKCSSSFDMTRSSNAGLSEYDSDSQRGSRMHFQSTDAVDYEEESPYAEVRAAVSNTDDPNMPVNTFRMWFLGLVFTLLISGLNQFFSMRYPSVYISGLVAQLVALPCGKFLERVLPTTRFTTFGYSWSLNPGPFNIKEHTLITVMSNVVASGAYATDVIATQRMYFNQHWGLGYQLLLCLSSQVIGFSFAGIVRRFLVWPSAMIYPGVLVNCALFNTLHGSYGRKEGKHMSRERFFLYAMGASFVWFWFPGYIFTALSIFNWVCWIAPNNVVVNQLFGYQTGLGMGFLTFDWSMISYIGSPLVIPWWAQVNSIVGFLIFFWFIAPILYYKNVFYAKYLPMSAPLSFDNTGMVYDANSVIQDGAFNEDLYKAYSPLYMPITFVLSYGSTFASFTAVVVHTYLWYRRDLVLLVRKSLKDNRDVHSRLMSIYPEVPQTWYAIMGLVAFALSIVTIHVWDTKLPVWGLLVALIVALVLLVPVGVIRAITNQTVAVQVLAELLVGYMLPGRPVAMMIFKTFSFISMSQALYFVSDLKLGHYMKIPPRLMFIAQVVATVECVVVVVFVQSWMFSNIPDLCSPDQVHHFTCPSTSTFATASVVWGGIGPARLFSQGGLYYPLTYFFLIGAILPIPFYYLAKRFPLSFWRYVNVPVILSGLSVLPPATGINFSSWFMFGAFFQYFMRRFHFRWWMRFNYILSAALDSGVAIAIIIIFFAVQFPKGGFELNWWGNTVWSNTADYDGTPFITLEEGQTFGPTTWS
ncbi:glutathione transporter [Phellopilus nigrolimitatus]|nr:glutathione transporter [Phellopilus nigrolimitatus]